MSVSWVPGANRTIQYWGGKFIGSKMNTNCACAHTTETTGWPDYKDGATAPHLTVMPNIAAQTIDMRQHFPGDRSSRSLVNLSGGVETNTLNVFQIEFIGTCDSRYRYSWGSKRAGVDYIYWPDAPDWLLVLIAPIFRWLADAFDDFRIEDAAPRGWVKYPNSYGINARQRMTFSEWRNAYGIFGHQHVPENTHGDPGDLPIARLVEIATATDPDPEPEPEPDPELPPTPDGIDPSLWARIVQAVLDWFATTPDEPEPEPDPEPDVVDRMNPDAYHEGAEGPHIVWIGERIELWSEALGLDSPYEIGPGPKWGPADQRGVQELQLAKWPGSSTSPGGDADGFPGPQTLAWLASDPPVSIIVRSDVMNVAGYNSFGQETFRKRTGLIAADVLDDEPDLLNVQEMSNLKVAKMRPLFDDLVRDIMVRSSGGSDGRYVYRSRALKRIGSGVFTVAKKFWFQNDDKQAAWLAFKKEDDGRVARGMDVSFHLESDKGAVADALRVKQMLNILDQTLVKATKKNVPIENILFAGDTNSNNWVRQAMADRGWVSVAIGFPDEHTPTFNGWGSSDDLIDYAFVHESALPVLGYLVSNRTSRSDHARLSVTRQLITK